MSGLEIFLYVCGFLLTWSVMSEQEPAVPLYEIAFVAVFWFATVIYMVMMMVAVLIFDLFREIKG